MYREKLESTYRKTLENVLDRFGISNDSILVSLRSRGLSYSSDTIAKLEEDSNPVAQVFLQMAKRNIMSCVGYEIVVGVDVESGKYDDTETQRMMAAEIGHLLHNIYTNTIRNSDVSEFYDSCAQLATTPDSAKLAIEASKELGALWIKRNEGEDIEAVCEKMRKQTTYTDAFYDALFQDACAMTQSVGSPAHQVAFYYLGEILSKHPEDQVLKAVGKSLNDKSINKQNLSEFISKLEAK